MIKHTVRLPTELLERVDRVVIMCIDPESEYYPSRSTLIQNAYNRKMRNGEKMSYKYSRGDTTRISFWLACHRKQTSKEIIQMVGAFTEHIQESFRKYA
jgi:metal-responsive CopG/Arc/MetJ family transcriptional regulator